MQAAADYRWLRTDNLHDVDLSTRRPASSLKVVAEHPESRPNALARGNLDPGLEPPITLAESPVCLEACRRVLALHSIGSPESFANRFDYKIAILLADVLWPVCVVLEFTIAPSISTALTDPFTPVRLS